MCGVMVVHFNKTWVRDAIAVLSDELNGAMVNAIQWFQCYGSNMSTQGISVIQCRWYSGLYNVCSVLKEETRSLSVYKYVNLTSNQFPKYL